jgi:hypothetical protein
MCINFETGLHWAAQAGMLGSFSFICIGNMLCPTVSNRTLGHANGMLVVGLSATVRDGVYHTRCRSDLCGLSVVFIGRSGLAKGSPRLSKRLLGGLQTCSNLVSCIWFCASVGSLVFQVSARMSHNLGLCTALGTQMVVSLLSFSSPVCLGLIIRLRGGSIGGVFCRV